MRFNELVLYDETNIPYIKTFHSTISPTKRNYNAHHHTECELSVFIDGEGIYAVRGKEYNFKVEDGQTLIEMNGQYYKYPITNAALDSTIRLVADIAKRNNIGENRRKAVLRGCFFHVRRKAGKEMQKVCKETIPP